MSHPKILTKVPGWLQPPGTESPLTLETNIKFYKSLLIAAFRYLYKRRALSTGLLTYNRDPGTSPGTGTWKPERKDNQIKKYSQGNSLLVCPIGADLQVFSLLSTQSQNPVSRPCVYFLKRPSPLDSPQGFPAPALKPRLGKRRAGRGTSSPARPETLHEPLQPHRMAAGSVVLLQPTLDLRGRGRLPRIAGKQHGGTPSSRKLQPRGPGGTG